MNTLVWNIVFGPRPRWWNLPRLILWSLFGNHDDGPYGIYAAEAHGDRDWRVALRWWARNPLHNLWFYTLAVPLLWKVALIGKGKDGNTYWPASRPGILLALNTLPYLACQTSNWSAYIGWRPQQQRAAGGRQIGAFGMALRRE